MQTFQGWAGVGSGPCPLDIQPGWTPRSIPTGNGPVVTCTPHLVLQIPLHTFWSLPLRCVTLASGSAVWGPGLRQELGLQEVAGLTLERLVKAVVTALSLPLSGSKGRGREQVCPSGTPPCCSWLLGGIQTLLRPLTAWWPGRPGSGLGLTRSKPSSRVDHSRDQAGSPWSLPFGRPAVQRENGSRNT